MIVADEQKTTQDVSTMSTNDEGGESRPSFMVGDQDDPDSPTSSLSNSNQDEDRDHFNQNLSRKPSAFDLAEKRKRLR